MNNTFSHTYIGSEVNGDDDILFEVPCGQFNRARIVARPIEAWGTAVFNVRWRLSGADSPRDFDTPVTITSAAPSVLVELDAVPLLSVQVATPEGAADRIAFDVFLTDQSILGG